MNGTNVFVGAGNLVREPHVRKTINDNTIASFTIAANRRVYDKRTQEWVDAADYIPVIVFGKLAEACEQYLRKGSPVIVEGRIQTRSWEGTDGQKVYKTEVLASSVTFVSGTKGGVDQGTQEHFDQKRNGYEPKQQEQENTVDDMFPVDQWKKEEQETKQQTGQGKVPF